MTELELTKRAKMYMDSLAQGIDPNSGEEICGDSVINDVRVARCFFYISNVLQQVIDNGGVVGAPPKKQEFCLTSAQLAAISPAPAAVRITEFANMLFSASDNGSTKRLRTATITDWLIKKGFMSIRESPDGKKTRVPTEDGRRIGMFLEMRTGKNGDYEAVFYSPSAQQFLLDNMSDIIEIK